MSVTRPGCEAISTRGVQRVVGVSTLGRGVAGNAGQVSGALAMDEVIESSGAGYRALRMPGFMENMLQQVRPLKDMGHRLPTCATRDVAEVAVEEAGICHAGPRTPEATTPTAFRQWRADVLRPALQG